MPLTNDAQPETNFLTDLTRAKFTTLLNYYGDGLSRLNLSFQNLIEASLSGVDLNYADLSYTKLSYGDLNRASLSGTHLSQAKLINTYLESVDLSHANLSHADLSSADLNGANLEGSHLNNANLRRAHLIGANLSNADLSHAYLIGANLSHAVLPSPQYFERARMHTSTKIDHAYVLAANWLDEVEQVVQNDSYDPLDFQKYYITGPLSAEEIENSDSFYLKEVAKGGQSIYQIRLKPEEDQD